MRLTFTLLTFFALTSSALAAPGAKLSVTLKPAGSFTASSAEVRVRGYVKTTGNLAVAKDIVIPVASFKTGVDLRDHHMSEKYFESSKYPLAVLIEASGKDGKFGGQLQLHGVAKPITGTYEVKGSEVAAHFKTQLSAFNIAPAKYMGVGVQDDVDVDITLPVTQR